MSFACIVKLYVAAEVGVPERTPPEESVIPLGRVPLVFVKTYGLLPPLAVMVLLYATFFFPSERLLGLKVIVEQLGVGVGVAPGPP